jgi:hypothetical protein
LLLFKNRGSQNDAFAALLDSCTQEQSAQVLLDGTWADVQFGGYVFVAATRDQQFQHLLIAAGDFDLIQVDHVLPLARGIEFAACGAEEWKASVSPKFRYPAQSDKYLGMLALRDEGGNP